MSKNRPKRAKQRKQSPLQEHPKKSPKRWSWRILVTPWALFLEIVSFLAAGLGLWEAYVHTEPEIHALSSSYSTPFNLPFSVKNPSTIFSMKDVTWVCGINRLISLSQTFPDNQLPKIEDLDFGHLIEDDIEPGETKNFICAIPFYVPDSVDLHVHLYVNFKTVLFNRTSNKLTMTWLPMEHPPRWVEGKIE